jgi:hypothetical protein
MLLPRAHIQLALLLEALPCLAGEKAAVPDKLLFDFEKDAELTLWSNLDLGDPKRAEPPASLGLTKEGASSGERALEVTFAGGFWPTIATTNIPLDWMPYESFRATVTASRACLVGFTVLQQRSRRFGDWDGAVTRWCKTEILKPGKNVITGALHPSNDYAINVTLGAVVQLELFFFRPGKDERIQVDDIRLSGEKVDTSQPATEFEVAGIGIKVASAEALGERLKHRWKRPVEKTVDQVEGEFRAKFEELKRTHPGAVLAVLRDGERGFDPANPDRVYAGWKDAYWTSHGPDGMTLERAENQGARTSFEAFMRHRSPLYRVDLSTIPRGAQILAATLVIATTGEGLKDHDPFAGPTMWVAEPCNRPWEELEVNAYEFAWNKFWKRVGGMYYGDDPDFLPMYLAHGPGQGKVNAWDFAYAVRFWTDGKHANHGFMLHGDSHDYMVAWSREAPNVKDRPAVLVIYERL